MVRPILEVRHLWVGEGAGASVRNVSFTVAPGELLAVAGHPGAGKSSLLRCIGLDFPPSSGAVLLGGADVARCSPEERRHLRGRRIELVHPPAADHGAGTGAFAGSPAQRLTVPVAGMRQRIQVARALANRSEVVLLDEPLAGLTDTVRDRIVELLGCLRRQAGTAVVMASRDLAVCRALADRVLVLEGGAVVASEEPAGRRWLGREARPRWRRPRLRSA
jgi:ABC-type glutathione transport system ATPase component